MKKILISARDLNIGGIEKSLITLIEFLLGEKYEITLVLESKKGELLEEIPKKVKIITYTPSKIKNKFIRKTINFIKRCKYVVKYGNKYDVSISYTTYLQSGSFVVRKASKKSILWCHADYLSLFQGKEKKVKEFFENLFFEEFSKIVFVSKSARDTFLKIFPNQKNIYFCNNLIDSKKIYELANENIGLKYNQEKTTFLNIGRHDEIQKKLTRIIEAAKLLKQENYDFRVVFVGAGQDTDLYKEMVKKDNLDEYIIFVGEKKNPYPYFKIANCVILSSDYEGYPVVFLESFVLNKPIITTKVSDFQDIQNGRGIVTNKSTQGIYCAMKDYIENGYQIKKEFDVTKYNQEVKKMLKKILKIY